MTKQTIDFYCSVCDRIMSVCYRPVETGGFIIQCPECNNVWDFTAVMYTENKNNMDNVYPTLIYDEYITNNEARYFLRNMGGTMTIIHNKLDDEWQEPVYQLSVTQSFKGLSRAYLLAVESLLSSGRVIIDLINLANRHKTKLPLIDPLSLKEKQGEA